MLKKKVVLIDSLIFQNVFNDIVKNFKFETSDSY